MADSDFERVCAAFMDAAEPVMAEDEIRRGMAAALREMREPSEAVTHKGIVMSGGGVLCSWQAMIDALLAQAEDREAAE